ncbi:MAG TPA: DUF4412 domain-containing protein, partial [Pyrinomonadaceae bacterium]
MNNIYKLSILIVTLIFTQTAFADVKIKTRQSMSGQTYEGTTYIKGKRQRSERNMGGMEMVDLTQCDMRRGIQLNPKTKTYVVNAFDTGETATPTVPATAKTDKVVRSGGTVTSTITVKDTGERKQMFGFTARHLIITMESVSSPDACTPYKSKMQTDGWYIDAEFYLDCQQNYAMRSYQAGKNGGCQDKYVSKQVGTGKRGYPLYEKMTMFDESGKETYSFVTEVVELSKATLEAALFDVPADYREVKDAAQMYQAANADVDDDSGKSSMNSGASLASNSGMKLPAQSSKNETQAIAAKKPGTIRIGISVKTGAVGDGISSTDLALAVQNTFGEYLKGTNVEIVPLEAKLAGSIDGEAKNKECDYVLYALASHKKGGGGFGGMFGKVIAPAIGQVGLVNTGSVAGNIAGHAAANAIISAGQISTAVKSKDEITLEIRLQQTGSGATVLTKQLKNKAKSDGQDIISP